MPFSNPILAGEELIRSGIRSENYDPGVEGWRIGADGFAEFLDALIRGSLTVTDVNGNTLKVHEWGGVLQVEWEFPSTNKSIIIDAEILGSEVRLALETRSPTLTAAQYLIGGANGGIAMRSSATGAPSVWFNNVDGFLYRGVYAGAITVSTWTNVALQNGWTSYVFAPWSQVAQYKLDVNGRVHLRGLIQPGIVASPTTLFNVPAAFRTKAQRRLVAPVFGGAMAEFNVLTNGDFQVTSWPGGGTGFSLDQMSWDVLS